MKFVLALLIFVTPLSLFAYEPTQTHAGLTEQVVEFYNLKFGNKINDTQKEFIIKGAIAEDEPETRAMNHFYDPIRNIGIEGGRTAKDWALDDLVTNDFSWNKAINAYARGDMNTAFIALGHNIHLIEDMGVPDHTRNDQHLPFLDEDMGGKSPYEDWTMENKNRNTLKGLGLNYFNNGIGIKLFPKLGEYFDFLANYSNKNFFSRDTILRQDVYAKPYTQFYEQNYGYWVDEISNKREKIVKRKVLENKDVLFVLRDDKDPSILSSYFDRLALQIIPSGAGVIDLFFKEGEQARIKYELEQKAKQQAEAEANARLAKSLSQKSVFGLVLSGAVFLVQDNIWTPIKSNILMPVGRGIAYATNFAIQEAPVAVNIGQFATATTADATKDAVVAGANFAGQVVKQGATIVQQTVTNTINTAISKQSDVSKSTTPTTSNIVQPQTVLTFEPKINTEISTPRLVFVGSFGGGGGAAAEPPPQILGTQTTRPVVEEILTTNETAVSAGLVMATTSPVLSVPQCLGTLATDGCLLATTTVHFEWSDIVGRDHYLVNKNGEYSTTTEKRLGVEVRDFSDYVFEVVAMDATGRSSATSSKKVSVASIPIAINEIAWMGTLASANDEWFELKNNTPYTIDLSQWELIAKDGAPHVKLAGAIKPLEYLVLERTADNVIKDITMHQKFTGALDDGGDQLSLLYASTTLDKTPSGKWVLGEKGAKIRKTMERISSKDSGFIASNWLTNNGIIKNGTDAKGNAIDGTPGRENSASIATTTVTSAPVVASSSVATTTAVATIIYPEPTAPVRQSDLNKNGINDSDESEVVATSTASLPAGEYHFHNLTITNNATLLLGGDISSATSTGFLGVKIIADNLTVSQGSAISADTSGYSGGPGAGGGYIGGSYGGAGGGNRATSTYGSAIRPLDLGSGANSRGGGAIRIIVSGSFLNDGSISANGGGFQMASGGSIYVNTNNLSGAGEFAVKGGNVTWPYYWSGGGGRIAVYYEKSTFIGSARADAGLYYFYDPVPTGQAGTVAFIDTSTNDFYVGHSFRFQKNDGPFNFNRVIIQDGASVSMDDGVTISANELIVQKGALVSSKGSVFNLPKITIGAGGTFILSGGEKLLADTVDVKEGGILTVAGGQVLSLNIPNLNVFSGGRISVDGAGYGYGQGPGTTLGATAGASYGGVGLWNISTSTYGSATEPTDFGSGGGGYNPAGGGVIRLIITNSLRNDGVVSADGSNTSSGGSIFVTANNLIGRGSFNANGGPVYFPNICLGSGGGGRVAVYYKTTTFSGSVLASGNTSYCGTSGSGTVGLFDTSTNDFYAGHSWRFQKNDGPFDFNRIIIPKGASVVVDEGVDISANELIIQKGASLSLSKGVSLDIPKITVEGGALVFSGEETINTDTITLTNGATVSVLPMHPLHLTLNDLSIDEFSGISVSYAGYGQMEGPGAPITNPLGGASYGGVGLWNTASSTYGSMREPMDMGSAGSGYNPRGGGALRLIVKRNLVNNGSISAYGNNTSSGGSIYVTANNLAGRGEFRADGGSVYFPNICLGSGGGGRIAIYYNTSTFGGSASSAGNNSYCGASGDGTVVMEQILPSPVPDETPPPVSTENEASVPDISPQKEETTVSAFSTPPVDTPLDNIPDIETSFATTTPATTTSIDDVASSTPPVDTPLDNIPDIETSFATTTPATTTSIDDVASSTIPVAETH